MSEAISAARAELAPSGKLRVGLNFGNTQLTARDPVTKVPTGGIALDLAQELSKRLGVPLQIVPFESAGALADAAGAGVWEVGFLGVEPQRAKEISFTEPYVDIETTYLVPPGSPLKSIADVDREGVRIALPAKSAFDLYLTRTLKHATLVRGQGSPGAFKIFVSEKLDALAGLRQMLMPDQENFAGSRLLDGYFTLVHQGVGTPKGHDKGAQYLRDFVEDVKANGTVARVIEKNGIRGALVAPLASASQSRSL
jgi:polar amino acid transport system substrate-binding protein